MKNEYEYITTQTVLRGYHNQRGLQQSTRQFFYKIYLSWASSAHIFKQYANITIAYHH